MNQKIIISILIILVVIPVTLFFLESKSHDNPVSEIGFIYSDIDDMQKILLANGIFMSSPTIITDNTVDQYCTYFDGDVKKSVQYCITTVLVNSDGLSLGNLNMGGNPISPIMALAVLETSPLLDSQKDEIDFIFQTMIETLVCDCWESEKPGNFNSVSAWLDAAKQQYDNSSQSTLKSKIDGLAQKQLTLEITFIENSYLWTLIVVK